MKRFVSGIRVWWAVIAAVVFVVFSAGVVYNQMCVSEYAIVNLTTNIEEIDRKVDKMAGDITSLEFTVINTSETVRDIQNILIRRQVVNALTLN